MTQIQLVEQDEIPRQPSVFCVAMAQWMKARAAVAARNADPYDPDEKDDDEPMAAALLAEHAAEWKLISAPANGIAEIRERAMVVQQMFNFAAWAGKPTDNRHRAMLDVLVAEILAVQS
jgi:hypothetical protein